MSADVDRYPLFEMLWLLLGTMADIWIACSMWTDAKRAKVCARSRSTESPSPRCKVADPLPVPVQTGHQTSSDSILQVLINVALRCGASLAMYVRPDRLWTRTSRPEADPPVSI